MSSTELYLMMLTSIWPFIIIILFIVFSKIKKIQEHKKQPIQTIDATLISKEMIPILTGAHVMSKVNVHYYLKFKLNDREEKEFEVTSEQYAVLLEGNIGKLTFKEHKFLSFHITKIDQTRSTNYIY